MKLPLWVYMPRDFFSRDVSRLDLEGQGREGHACLILEF